MDGQTTFPRCAVHEQRLNQMDDALHDLRTDVKAMKDEMITIGKRFEVLMGQMRVAAWAFAVIQPILTAIVLYFLLGDR